MKSARLQAKSAGIKKKQAAKKRNAPSSRTKKSKAAMADQNGKALPKQPGVEPSSERLPPRFTLMGLLSTKHDETAPLEDQIKFMEKRHESLAETIAALMNENELLKDAFNWHDTLPGEWSKSWRTIIEDVEGFAFNNCYRDFTQAPLTSAQKKKLVSSLDDYCLQDFDDLVSRLNPGHRKNILVRFASAYLIKNVIEKFFHHPFWYAEANPAEAEKTPFEEVSSDGIDKGYARLWRNIAVRLCHNKYDVQSNYAEKLETRRQTKCHSLAKQILEDKTFKCLLAPTEKPSERATKLGAILMNISTTVIYMLSQNPTISFRTIHELEPKFHHKSPSLEADYQHGLDVFDPSARLDGRDVLMIQYPMTVYTWVSNGVADPEEYVIGKALAIMDDPDDKESV
ncbi:hypothetical protein BJY04DRAFT_220644 [Aspergillus karnatakaensis]|uniref:uncharacterized protein n=1 Tax=Aspergillus karnatakaensis TaxID=1810916 RepID=UPI003CCDC449